MAIKAATYRVSGDCSETLKLFLLQGSEKDIVSIYSAMPAEQILPMIVTSVAVTMIKVVGMATVILLVRWVVGKIRSGKKTP